MNNLIGYKMGLRFKGRTEGKDAWINYSASSKGLHASTSVKFGDDITVNIGKNGTRTTFNLGGGLSYVADRPHYKPTKTQPKRVVYKTYTKEEIAENDAYLVFKVFPVFCSIVIAIVFLFNI